VSADAAPIRLDTLRAALDDFDSTATAAERLELLIQNGLDALPLPGRGRTLLRWQALASVAAVDLSLAKLYEGHTDALAILAELGEQPGEQAGRTVWGVWGAEAPQGRTSICAGGIGRDVRLRGAKCWCSGAASADSALVTAWHDDGRRQLVSVDLLQSGVRVSDSAWQAVGMAASASLDVVFDQARARLIGEPGAYIDRPGFLQGGAGIAACWYGGALAVADTLRRSVADESRSPNPFQWAALGRVDVAMSATAALLRECAEWIDKNPAADAGATALRARLSVEETATFVLNEVGRALGATPYCRDERFARFAADLPVFIRQSHAERDLAALGRLLLDRGTDVWSL
jgi:alkylation response protein AidB-like acyl-CoA dehydrogenase